MKRFFTLFSLFALIASQAEEANPKALQNSLKSFSAQGYFWIRHDARASNFIHERAQSLTFSRLNLTGFYEKEKTKIVINPQFSRVWGDEVWGDRHNAVSGSGTFNNPALTMHQAYMSHRLTKNLSFTAGRKELSFGDELIVARNAWNYIGRSFDVFALDWKFWSNSSVKFFSSKLEENDWQLKNDMEQDFHGVYAQVRQRFLLEELDLYVFQQVLDQDSLQTGHESLSTYGVRAKSETNGVSLIAELALQEGLITDSQLKSAQHMFQVRGIKRFSEINLEVGVNQASADWNQVYHAAHRWLGHGDHFQRRNLVSVFAVLGISLSRLSASFAAHQFWRLDTNRTLVSAQGDNYGSEGTASEASFELDVDLRYRLDKNLSVQAGLAYAMAQSYFKDQGVTRDPVWGHLSLSSSF